MKTVQVFLIVTFSLTVSQAAQKESARRTFHARSNVQRVLLISIDGFHAVDLANYVKMKPSSALARAGAPV